MESDDIVYELICDSCGEEYTISVYDNGTEEIPIFCPFCGQEIDMSDFDEDEDDLEDDDEDQSLFDDEH